MDVQVIRVLVVDDNKDNARLLKTLLTHHGYDVDCAANGAAALDRLHSQSFDLIISDILMPVMDGFQLCRNVKQEPELKDIPFIFYTATYTDEKDEVFALKIGADLFVRKPADPDEFLKQVQSVTARLAEGKEKPEHTAQVQEKEALQLYNERLINKLEQKVNQLTEANARLLQSEASLKESESKFRLLIESIPGALSITQDGKMVFANRITEKITGYTADELMTLEKFALVIPEDREKVQR